VVPADRLPVAVALVVVAVSLFAGAVAPVVVAAVAVVAVAVYPVVGVVGPAAAEYTVEYSGPVQVVAVLAAVAGVVQYYVSLV